MNPPQTSPRQTQSYIRDLLRSRRLMPKNKMGQNFLIDLNLLDLIVQTAELSHSDSVLEVGTGTGSLTAKISDKAGALTSVELDLDFSRMAFELHSWRPNLSLMHHDILERKNEMNPGVMAEWERMTIARGCTSRKLVANLPYVVATPVIANLLIAGPVIDRMVVMVQWEMAERMMAQPSTKAYGSLAILVQALARVSIVRRLPPTAFWPQPKVDSAIIDIRPDPEMRKRIPDVAGFRAFLRDLYTQRRKSLRHALSGWPGGRREKKDVDAKLAEAGIDGASRAEAHDLAMHLRLYEIFGN